VEGRSKGGKTVKHAPIKRVVGRSWMSRVPKGAVALFKRRRTVMVNGKPVKRTFYRVETVNYRFGGQPLRDTGKLQRSLSALGSAEGNTIKIAMRGLRYGAYHDRGFKTRGRNFIPLTKKGKRQHGTGNNPELEGLVRGRDYIVTGTRKIRRGVTVPSRPFIMPTRDDLRTLGTSIYLGLRSLLKG